MAESPIAVHASSAAELQERLAAERRGLPFLIYRDAGGAQHIVVLPSKPGRLTVGRRAGSDVELGWDTEVSRLHAELELIGDEWTVLDDGLSHNGTYLNGGRIPGRQRLRDGDSMRFGQTIVVFADPGSSGSSVTRASSPVPRHEDLSAGDREVLIALCRPLKDDPYGVPATNQEIAAELHLSIQAVKSRLHGLFERFGLQDLPQNQKRARLASDALQSGTVSSRDL
jgi:pSer/pThr/pTyr-binding forkhead associated (FHA) protein